MNLVLASMDQIEKIPGINAAVMGTITNTQKGVTSGTSNPCNSPTFRPGQSPNDNVLVQTAPFPPGCNAACQAPWKGKYVDPTVPGGGTGDSHKGKGSGPGSGTGPGSGSGTPGGSAPGGADHGGETCNAATGVCTPSSSSADPGGTGSGNVATVLPAADGWATPQTLGIIVVILLVALLVVPPVVSTIAGRRNRRV
jgi:phosphate transport system substrate-binding protein